MSGELRDLSQQPPPPELSTDVCIIGSGPGGATAAARLAAAGREVLVLEEGGDFVGPALNQRDGAMYDQLYMERGGRATEDLAVSVLQGRVLGGGAVINACDVVPISDEILELWRRRFGLSELTAEAFEPSRRRALEDLSAQRIDESQLNTANRLLRSGAEALGLKGEVMMHNRVGCAGLGTCLIGCPINAKKNPRFVAIPRALDAGARFYTRARAVRIEQPGQEIKRVVVRTLDPMGYHETGDFVVRARTVIIAANAVGSAQLLLRSGAGNRHVGLNLSLQPQLPLIAVFEQEVQAFRGIPQAYAVTEHERFDPQRGLSGFRIEAVMGTPGIVGSLIPFAGKRAQEAMALYPHLAAALLLVPDQSTGSVALRSDQRPLIRYTHAEEHKQRLRQAIKVGAQVYFAAGARQVIVPTLPPLVLERDTSLAAIDALSLEPASAPLISAHQQGTVRFSPTAEGGGADPGGQVWGTRGLYVFDSSGFPTSSSTHTMAPILSIAHYLSDRLLSSLPA